MARAAGTTYWPPVVSSEFPRLPWFFHGAAKLFGRITFLDCAEYYAIAAMYLNAQAQQYDGYTPGQWVFGRTPKNLTGADG